MKPEYGIWIPSKRDWLRIDGKIVSFAVHTALFDLAAWVRVNIDAEAKTTLMNPGA